MFLRKVYVITWLWYRVQLAQARDSASGHCAVIITEKNVNEFYYRIFPLTSEAGQIVTFVMDVLKVPSGSLANGAGGAKKDKDNGVISTDKCFSEKKKRYFVLQL